MSITLKALGISILAALATGALGVVTASANGSGHFVSELHHMSVGGGQAGVLIKNHGLGEYKCDVGFAGTTTVTTTTALNLTPSFTNCGFPVDWNGCTYSFTVASLTTDETEQTLHLLCPVGQALKFTSPNCTISLPPQTNLSGVTYKRVEDPASKKHQLKVDLNIELFTTRHGPCQLTAPTNGTGTLQMSMTLAGSNPTTGERAHLTAT